MDPILVIAIVFVLAIIVGQIIFWSSTRSRIRLLHSFFQNVHQLEIVTSKVSRSDLSSAAALDRISSNPQPVDLDVEDMEDSQPVNLIHQRAKGNDMFTEVVKSTNAYLCKNVGTSADLNILEDICERKIDSLETEISQTLNVPLYLGLGGTFLGIITGVFGVSQNIQSLFDTTSDMSSLQNLLWGVGIAMVASFIGLGLMVWNSAFSYKSALSKADEDKNAYYDFLRRELMPTLSNSMASSLNSLRGVLGHFVDSFGQNLDAYADSAQLLNENLERQHLVLTEINKLGVTKTAQTINETFLKLKESSDALDAFYDYQEGLNSTIEKVDGSVEKIEDIITNFKHFTDALEIVIKNQTVAADLQKQFRESIEQNFPTGSDAREAWRKQFDALVEDATKVTNALGQQLAESTEYIKSFVDGNKAVFEAMGQQEVVIQKLIDYAKIQGSLYEDLKKEMASVKESFTSSQKLTIEVNQNLLLAVREMTAAVKNQKK